jgi:trimeric autotransporter adhesin
MQHPRNIHAAALLRSALQAPARRGRPAYSALGAVALVLALVSALAASTATAWAQTTESRPVARVTTPVDDSLRSMLAGHVSPALHNAQDIGRLSSQTALDHMVMVLQPAPEQDHALQTLLDQQLDKGSPNWHKWVTPEEFGARFGVADADVAKVTDWLTRQGFKVEKVANSKRFIQFSGKVTQVETAFRTEMHSYNVNGAKHVSNNSDISVPAALRQVIAGVPTLNDFFKTSDFRALGSVAAAGIANGKSQPAAASSSDAPNLPTGKFYFLDPASVPFSAPAYTNGTTHFVGAGDFASIYNTTPLLTGGFDGTGISIGIVGRTDISLEDVQLYRQMFGLKVNDPHFIVVGEDPGLVPGDDGESSLDVEVSGGAAPGATVDFVVSRATLTTDGVDLSAMYIVDNNLTDVVSESYGQCEANFTAAAISFYSNLWGQAAAQGESVFVSSGDNGPASCDNSNSNFSSFGYAVSGLASSPYNVAVGGTIFADTTGGPWWGTTATTTAPFASALGYIPEQPWNEAKGSGAVGAAGLWSGSGGISAYIPTPAWQHGFGVPASDPAYPNAFKSDPATPFVPGPHRYMPDVAMAAAAQHDGTLYCNEGICQLSNTGAIVNAGIVGGTSVAAPTMAGVQALIDAYNGGRQGMPNYVYYSLADAQHTAGLDCGSTSATLNANCAFHDIIAGNTLICGNSGCTAGTKLGWTATPGYDMATGLGSPNVYQLATLWNTVTFRSTNITLGASQTTGITHGQAVTMSGSVTPGTGTGTPTGTVTFIPSSGALGNPMDPNTGAFLNAVPLATLDGSGNYSIAVTNLPAGTYSLVARYSGDGTFSSSTSAPLTLTVTQESATVTIAPNAFNGTTCIETPQTTFTYGSYVWTDVTVAGASGQGSPTGTVSITDNGNPLLTVTLNSNGVGHFLSGAIPTTSCVSGYTFQDFAPFTVGSHVLGGSYSGDTSFGAATAATVTVIIGQATVTQALATSATNISSGGSVQLTYTLTALSGAGPGTLSPTGTVTFTDNTTATVLGTATLAPGAAVGSARAVLTTTGITTAGANSIVASWPGDTNYGPLTSTAVTVTVQGGTATSVAVTSNANPAAVGGRPTFTATMTPTTVTSGTVNFFDGNLLLGSGTVGAAHTATFRPAASVSLLAGVHMITAVYAGNATFNSSTSAPFSQTFNQTATTIQLTAKNAGTYGQNFTMSGALGLAGTVVPGVTGTMQFLDGASPLGSPQSFTIVTAASGGLGLWQSSLTNKMTAGVHTMTATLSDPNYTAPVSNNQTITIAKANPTLTNAGGTFTYNGNPHGGSGTALGALNETLPVTLTYTGTGATTYGPSGTAPTDAGTYQVSASTTGDSNNNAGTAATPAALTINKATSTVAATGGTFTYDGNPHGGSGSATGGAGESLPLTLSYSGTGSTIYGPSTSAPVDAGSYLISASTVGDENNNAGTSPTAAALTINKATPIVAVNGGTFTYNGSPQGGSGSATGGAGESLTLVLNYSGTGSTVYGPTGTAPTNAGTYLVAASTAGDANNSAGAAKSAAALTINKATATIGVTAYCAAFDGAPHTATGSATGVIAETLTGLDLTGTTHSAVGTYATDPWTFSNANYSNQAGSVGDAITDATITAPTGLAPESTGSASVADAGAGATYAWSITGGAITGGAGTNHITFTSGTTGTASIQVTVTTTTGCSASQSANVAIDPAAQVPTLGTFGLIALASLLALAGAFRLGRN